MNALYLCRPIGSRRNDFRSKATEPVAAAASVQRKEKNASFVSFLIKAATKIDPFQNQIKRLLVIQQIE